MTSRHLPGALPHRAERNAAVSASPEQVFALLDDHNRLASHMSRSSWQMGGGSMKTIFNESGGQNIGSHIRMSGRVLGIKLSLYEVVTERDPPTRKVWETVGTPRLLVSGSYRMGFELTPVPTGSQLRVFIEYALPIPWLEHWLGRLFGGYYARWCTHRMVNDAVQHFSANAQSDAGSAL